ncbi:MAG: methylated-DNA--[protein]-cysteine S-methyltransferase [Alphaproteobacteria bacterium]|nr:methylated-DNA--[protein]-cysteine S-methyltransferase [Alphaproteobacteria bacterium]
MGSLVVASPVGNLLLRSEHESLISLGWDANPAADSAPDPDRLLREAARQLKAYFARRLTRFDLQLRPQGSGFQQRVWGAIAAIPHGQTRQYGDLARMIGSVPRPVGQACGRNPIPIIIPCHRVLGAAGQLTGYSGAHGVTTKEFLLRLEGAVLI